MSKRIYVERSVSEHPRTRAVLARFPRAAVIEIDRYGEVFNRRNQNFRLQKKQPALILADKFSSRVLPTPPGYGIGGENNFYFSHLLNCVYDCRYCFLQGMYRSANYVLFVNYEDFFDDIETQLARGPDQDHYFFSGYDCDSLAMESLTGFVSAALPFFRDRPRAWLELRTKSVQIRPLVDSEPFKNCVVAYSLTPDTVARAVEHKAPPGSRRIDAMAKLAEKGWSIGLRFDPLIHGAHWMDSYRRLFDDVFAAVPRRQIHSVSYGPLRFPKKMYKDIVNLYPEEALFAGAMDLQDGMVAYPDGVESEMAAYCSEQLREYLDDSIFFQCLPEVR
ncbi:MAG: DNA photolyase [Myxococcales bacterium]|nr:DNA photolyase [Myxococcales bacterium]